MVALHNTYETRLNNWLKEDAKVYTGLSYIDLYYFSNQRIIVSKHHDNHVLDYEKALKYKKYFKEHLNGKVDFFLADMRGLNFHVSKEANVVFKNFHKDDTVKAVSILVKNLYTRLYANFFIQMDKPYTPTKCFQDPQLALDWLKKH